MLKRFAASGGLGGRPDGRGVHGAMGFEWMERAVEGRKEEQDAKAVSKYNLDVMDEGRIITINAGLVGLAFMFI